MNDPTVTAEDLTLYALGLLEGKERARVEEVLRASAEARAELASTRGDLAMFSLATEQHTPSALTRQRLLKQVARERRETPIDVPLPERQTNTGFAASDSPLQALNDPAPSPARRPVAPLLKAPQHIPVAQPRLDRETEVVSSTMQPVALTDETARMTSEANVFGRDAQPAAANGPEHAINMFEKHFAEGQAGSGTVPARDAAEADAVADRFTLSSRKEAPARNEDGPLFRLYEESEGRDIKQGNAFTRLFGWSGWALAAAMGVAAVFALRDDFHLREQTSQQQTALSAAKASAARADVILQTLQSPAAQRFVLARTDTAPVPGGRVAYLPERGSLVFQGSNLQSLQPEKTYELWLIPAGEGRQPIPAGTFKPDAHGDASVVLPALPKGMIAANFGVTIEAEGGSSTPTLPILLVGQAS